MLIIMFFVVDITDLENEEELKHLVVPTLDSLWQEKTSETIWRQIFSSGSSGSLCRKIWFPCERLVMSGSRMMVVLKMRIDQEGFNIYVNNDAKAN